jgi:hypothetical protein
MTHENDEQAILGQERRALDQWASGNPLGYVDTGADDVTYFDDIGAHGRVDGLEAVRTYFRTLEDKIPPHKYEVVNPRVQVYDDIGILTLRYRPSDADGNALTQWKATSVYRRSATGWRLVHAHWSILKQ